MRRREFITVLGGAAAWSLAARAQPADRVRRIAILSTTGDDDVTFQERMAALQQSLQKAGWSEGRNVRFEYRAMLGDVTRAQEQARDLVALSPDVIVTNANVSTAIVARQTNTIPIVFATAGDPVGTGLVTSMARPGGNVTGFATYEAAIGGKWLELLREIVPDVRRVAVVYTPGGAGSMATTRTAVALASSLGIPTTSIPAGDAVQIDRDIDAFAGEPGGSMIVMPGPTTFVHANRIIAAADRHRLPAIHPGRHRVAIGGLMSYMSDTVDLYRRAATYVDRILRGEWPGDLPVQAPTKYELVINLKTAKAMGLTIAESFLLRADEVIE